MQSKSASNRSFGLLIAAVLALVGVLQYWVAGESQVAWFVVAAFFLAVSLAMPRVLLPLKRLWLKLGSLLHHIISPIVLAFLYVFSILLIGSLARLFGKEFLSLKRDTAAASYWIRRDPPGPSPQSLRNQF
jgi:hypothetical protein